MFGVFEGPLVFSFLFAAAVIGCFALLVLAVIPAVYSFPYLVWFGFNCGTKSLPKEMSWLGPPEWFFLHQAANATKLYRSWLTGKPHNIKNF